MTETDTQPEETSDKPRYTRLPERGVIRLSGPEAKEFLQGLITNDVAKASPTQTLYAALLTPQGKYLFDFILAALDDNTLLLDTDRNRIDDLVKRLTLYKLRAKVELADVSDDYVVGALFGGTTPVQNLSEPGACATLEGGIIYADPRLTALGHRLLVAREKADAAEHKLEAEASAPDAYATFRIHLGVPESGHDLLPEKSFLLESNFDELHGVDHKKGCYIGQEVTSRTKRKAQLRKRLLPLTIDAPDTAPGTPILAGDVEVGTVTSTAQSAGIGLIRLDRAQQAQDAGTPLTANGAAVSVTPPPWIDLGDWTL